MLTIGELARLAGTTVRAVRHYHRIGLIPEPERDRSGYRRYGATALVRLLRVRRMRELGLPLERIAELLDGDEPTLHEALDALDAELAAQAERIAAQRAGLAELRAASPDPELPEPLAAIFAEAAAAGASARELAREKEVLLIDLALHPESTDLIVTEYLAMYHRMTAVPGYRDLVRRFDELTELSADSPVVEGMAAELAELIRAEHEAGAMADRGASHPRMEQIIVDWSETLPPAQRRALELAIAIAADRGGVDSGAVRGA
jgi:DNA-binding transcriptional MerR regulator